MKRILLIVTILATACRAERPLLELPLQDYTERQPSLSSIAGTYRPDEGSQRWLARNGLHVIPTLVVTQDGRFRFSDVAESIATGLNDERHRSVVNVEGTWSLKKCQGAGWCLGVQGTYRDICFDRTYLLRGEGPRYRIDCPIGDRVTGFPFTFRAAA